MTEETTELRRLIAEATKYLDRSFAQVVADWELREAAVQALPSLLDRVEALAELVRLNGVYEHTDKAAWDAAWAKARAALKGGNDGR